MNPFDILGISRTSSVEQAKQAYRKLAMKYHPDRNRSNAIVAERKFKEIKEAWELIEKGWSAPVQAPPPPPKPTAKPTQPSPVYVRPQVYRPPAIVASKIAGGSGDNLGTYQCFTSLAQAYNGFEVEITIGNDRRIFRIPGGCPPNAPLPIAVPDTNKYFLFQLQFKLSDFAVSFKPTTTWYNVEHHHVVQYDTTTSLVVPYRSEVKTVMDFLGKPHATQLPFYSDNRATSQQIVIPKAGYSLWSPSLKKAIGRGDLIVNIMPQDRATFV